MLTVSTLLRGSFPELYPLTELKLRTHETGPPGGGRPPSALCGVRLSRYLSGILQCLSSRYWLLSFSVTFSRFLRVVACVTILFPF